MLPKLPGWCVDDATSVREEMAEWVGTSPAERLKLTRLCSRDAMWAARASESTVAALRRLSRDAGWGAGSQSDER